jgi:hypothetical protein
MLVSLVNGLVDGWLNLKDWCWLDLSHKNNNIPVIIKNLEIMYLSNVG